ncbi:hypothetical protein J4417_01465 [Candidatus Woesearchaeota archaeon]|nr:hypothetical protein [Candidatus Woesearchaeota archaeon]
MNRKRAQIIGQVFIYILAIVAFAAILSFGYIAVQKLLTKQCDVKSIKFKTDLESTFTGIFGSYGKVRNNLDFTLPCETKKVCFVDFDYDGEKMCDPDTATPQVCNYLSTYFSHEDAEQNVFLDPPSEIKLKVSPINKSGRIKLLLEGKGTYVQVSEALPQTSPS